MQLSVELMLKMHQKIFSLLQVKLQCVINHQDLEQEWMVQYIKVTR